MSRRPAWSPRSGHSRPSSDAWTRQPSVDTGRATKAGPRIQRDADPAPPDTVGLGRLGRPDRCQLGSAVAAAIVASTSFAVCAADKNHASNCDGGG